MLGTACDGSVGEVCCSSRVGRRSWLIGGHGGTSNSLLEGLCFFCSQKERIQCILCSEGANMCVECPLYARGLTTLLSDIQKSLVKRIVALVKRGVSSVHDEGL